jgi:PAS domain-containing protein
VEPDLNSLLDEMRRLRRVVGDLEERVRTQQGRGERDSSQVANVMKLLKQKDSRLGEMDEQLEQKNEQLQALVDQLKRKNEELTTWVSSLRLYQDIFENEPSAMIGLNLEGRILLFNKAAAEMFGDAIKTSLMKEIESLDFAAVDPQAPALARRVLRERAPQAAMRADAARSVESRAFPIRVGMDVKGVLLKITVSSR